MRLFRVNGRTSRLMRDSSWAHEMKLWLPCRDGSIYSRPKWGALTNWKEAVMARPASGANLNIAQLQRALQPRQSELQKLYRKRAGLERKLNALDRRIERVDG